MEIVLVRHGKPEAAEQGEKSGKISAKNYTSWIRDYNNSGVALSSRPSFESLERYEQYYCLSSNLKRAIQSAEIFTGNKPEQQWPILKEMEIPRYKLPFKLKPYTWLILSRALWLMGVKKGISSRVETFKQAKLRAEVAANQLIKLAEEQKHIIVFAHGMTNRYMKKELVKKGWFLTRKDSLFWGETCFKKP
jgi:broad specificity phosphatase PhoE